VLAQTFTDWECLCVNDGSTDESGAILDEHAQKDPRFRVLHKKNGGVGSARNCGITNAHGDYILFLDGDDAFVSNALKVLWEVLITEKVDILKFNHRQVKQHGEISDIVISYDLKCQVYDLA
jgi:glycosyltransferase involved in cell wall biosynthesis